MDDTATIDAMLDALVYLLQVATGRAEGDEEFIQETLLDRECQKLERLAEARLTPRVSRARNFERALEAERGRVSAT